MIFKIKMSFYRFENGGRKSIPLLKAECYRPHLRIAGNDEYLGVVFMDGDVNDTGRPFFAEIRTLYENVDYSDLTPGACFHIMEGARIVGEGTVICMK